METLKNHNSISTQLKIAKLVSKFLFSPELQSGMRFEGCGFDLGCSTMKVEWAVELGLLVSRALAIDKERGLWHRIRHEE